MKGTGRVLSKKLSYLYSESASNGEKRKSWRDNIQRGGSELASKLSKYIKFGAFTFKKNDHSSDLRSLPNPNLDEQRQWHPGAA